MGQIHLSCKTVFAIDIPHKCNAQKAEHVSATHLNLAIYEMCFMRLTTGIRLRTQAKEM